MRIWILLLALVACSRPAPTAALDAGVRTTTAPKLALDDRHPLIFGEWHELPGISDYHAGPCERQPVPAPPRDSSHCHGSVCEGGWTLTMDGSKVTARTAWEPGCTYAVEGLAYEPRRDAQHRLSLKAAPKPKLAAERTPAQLALAACAGADGRWYCPSVRRPLMASGAQPVFPASWTVPDWYIDPTNSTGCASDSNSGTSATCGTSGIGPLLTYQELNVHRWGCFGNPVNCPRLHQDTTLEFLSSQVDGADSIYLYPAVEEGYSFFLEGALTQTATGTLASVTSKARATNVLLQASIGSAVSAAEFGDNTTHASYAWTYNQVSGNTWYYSQPFAPITLPFLDVLTPPAEVDTWANGDSVKVYGLPTIDLHVIRPYLAHFNGSNSNGIFVYHLNLRYNQFQSIKAGNNVRFVESSTPAHVVFDPFDLYSYETSDNSYVGGAFDSNFYTYAGATQQIIIGGVCGAYAGSDITDVGTFLLDGDVIVAGGNSQNYVFTTADVGYAAVDTGATLWNQANGGIMNGGLYGGSVLYGAGMFRANGRFTYPSGAGAAAAAFKLAGGLLLNNQGTGCLGVPDAASAYGTCNISITAAHLDSNLGATSGCVGTPNGGAFCNYGP